MTQVVQFTKQGNIGVIAIDNPPVNALSHSVRVQLREVLAQSVADAAVEALVICCEGRTFIAGADIREFGKTPLAPDLPELVEFLATVSRPVVAAIHGAALGGGLELALCCHFRVALPSAKLGLPEVTLGILPGAGGTQRLPRLIGARAALDMIVGGAAISASKAHALGLIDELLEGDVKTEAVVFAKRVLAERRPLRQVSDLHATLDDPKLFSDYERSISQRSRGFLAPFRCIEAVRAAVELPFEEGRARERELFIELMGSPESKAQRHAFFGEREVVKLSDVPADSPTREVKRAAVLGAGAVGTTIVASFVEARIPITLLESSQAALDSGVSALRGSYAAAVAKGDLKQAQMDERLSLIRPTLSYQELRDVDLVIDAMFEEETRAYEAFAKLDSVCKPGAILATSAPRVNIDRIATATKRPQDVLGMAFHPLDSARLLENVRAARTAPEVCASAMKLGKALGKLPVLSRASAGFVGERLFGRGLREAQLLVEEGASPQQVDRALQAFGFPFGPFAHSDRAGQSRATLEREATRVHGVTRRLISEQEILERYLHALINEGARILGEEVAPRPLEIDMIAIHGYGFPVYRGGPLFYADQLGLQATYQTVLEYGKRVGGEHWMPAPLLERLAKSGQRFYGAA
jgi:3-hydroxyacyl-CoA dehydrogenase